MKRPDRIWKSDPVFEEDLSAPEHFPPMEDEPEEEERPEFAAIRRIELLTRLHRMAFRSLFREDGLPPAQAGAMRVIIRYPGMSQRELADKLHIQRATTTVMLQKMEKGGYINRRPDPEDQRVSRIYPTDMAMMIETENHKRVTAYFGQCFEGIDPDSLEALLRTLGQVEENLRNILSRNPQLTYKE